jgi:subtilisin family serine protease
VEYRLSLKNLTDSTLKNPVIRYFAENPKIQYCRANPNDASCSGMPYGNYQVDSTLRAEIDYWSKVDSVRPKYYYDSEHSMISLHFYGNIPAHSKSVVHFRIMRRNYPAWNCTYDYSFQSHANVQEEHYKMAVYDGNGNILWGNDPVAVVRDTLNVYWYDRAGMMVVSQYDGSDSAKTLKGRFWLLKEKSLTDGERTSLNEIGANLLETTRYQGRGLHLLKSALPIKKKTLDSALLEFYNAFSVDDTTRIPLTLYPDDIYEQTQTCNANNSCTTVVNTRSAIDMVVECWPDLPMSACKQVVMQCSGDTAYIDRRIILAKVYRDSLQCLERHRDVKSVRVRQKGILTNDKGRKAVNLTGLQDVDFNWQRALQAVEVTTDWLAGADYTGEGVTVGVYDGGIDFSHPGFNELDSLGNEIPRKAEGYDDERTFQNRKDDDEKVGFNHGTHVAGIIGGNGGMSETVVGAKPYQFRGVAPKVKFFSDTLTYHNQRGNVVNHSHFTKEGTRVVQMKGLFVGEVTYKDVGLAFYGENHSNLDWNIFNDWKDFSDMGDCRTKTVVTGTGNNGFEVQHSNGLGYHSIINDSKNAIIVGNFDPETMTLYKTSSLGPTWDGRIKPDIMAPGTNIMSSVPYGLDGKYYDRMGGTSMAAPFVSGVAALMYQKLQKSTGLPLDSFSMRNSTTKALMIHSAIDMQGCSNENVDIANLKNQPKTCTPYTYGPDFATGWGRVNAKGALALIDKYDVNTRMFANFREFAMYEGVEKQKSWNIFVREGRSILRTTLAWDDAPGDSDIDNYMVPKLVNDLDLYLVSPSGKIYYPWRLDSLPTQSVDQWGWDESNDIRKRLSYEKISFEDASKPAYNGCGSHDVVLDACFDRLNNVEVVDVDNPEPGLWQVVARGFRVETGNSPDGKAQIASIASDFELMDKMYNEEHPYEANAKMWEIRDLGDGFLEHYVTFSPETSLGAGDHIYLYDEWDNLIGDYMGNSLANQRVIVKTRFLKIILFSNNDNSQGWGYSISKIEHIPYGVLQVLFPPYKKGD